MESEEKDDRIRGREEKMKETGRIKLKEIPFSRTFETGNGEELCNATGYAVQFDNEKTPLGFPFVPCLNVSSFCVAFLLL